MECWSEAENCPNYLISDEGQVVNRRTGKSLHPYRDKDGYLIVDLFNEFGRSTKKVHRLVAQAFLEPSLFDLEVNHRDTDKTNNHVLNLELVSHPENMRHALKFGLQPKEFRPFKVRYLDTGDEFDSLTEASKVTGAHLSAISAVVNGHRRRANGLRFEFIKDRR